MASSNGSPVRDFVETTAVPASVPSAQDDQHASPSKQTGGGGEERHAEEAAFLWGYAAGSGQDLGAGEDEWKRYLAALSTTEVAG